MSLSVSPSLSLFAPCVSFCLSLAVSFCLLCPFLSLRRCLFLRLVSLSVSPLLSLFVSCVPFCLSVAVFLRLVSLSVSPLLSLFVPCVSFCLCLFYANCVCLCLAVPSSYASVSVSPFFLTSPLLLSPPVSPVLSLCLCFPACVFYSLSLPLIQFPRYVSWGISFGVSLCVSFPVSSVSLAV